MTQVVPDYLADLLDGNDLEDQTAVQVYAHELPAAGETAARMVVYVELGKHERKAFQGKAKDPAHKVRIGFELLAKKHIKEIEVDGVKKAVAPRIYVEWDKIINDKSKFFKLLQRMRLAVPSKADATHLARFLNEPVKLKIVHSEVGEGANKKTYANIDFDSISEALGMNEEGETFQLKVAEATAPLQLFLWDKPTKPSWDALFIDGERTVKDEKGEEKKVSKNFIQAQLVSSLDFKGSKLEMLLGAGDMPDLTAVDDSAVDATPEVEPETDVAEEPKAKTTKAKTSAKAADAMADLGLV